MLNNLKEKINLFLGNKKDIQSKNKKNNQESFIDKQINRKKLLLLRLNKNIYELEDISTQLLIAQEYEYEKKIQKLLENTFSCQRILNKLDISKPYSKEIMIKIKNHTNIVNNMVIELCSE